MATCKDCVHYECCSTFESLAIRIILCGENADKRCGIFKNKADFAEVKHGEWIYHECVSSYEGTISGYSCSICSAFVDEDAFEADTFHKKYCGNCGAKMKER